MNAIDYRELGVSVIPVLPRTKRPPVGFPLRKYLARPATACETARWFDDGKMGVGVVLGAVSDNLTVRDFDVADAFHRWAAKHSALARRLPTAKTSRGFHVYFCADTQDVRDAGNGQADIIFCGDGELRHAGYFVAPESIHPAGSRYKWLVPPSDFPFVSDLEKAGLLESGTHTIRGPVSEVLSGGWDGVEIPVTVAIESTQPNGFGERHNRIFKFACMLKMTEMATATLSAVRPVFEEWFRLAVPRVRTKRFSDSWLDFAECWPRVTAPRTQIADIAARCNGDGIDRLESLCRELQIVAGDGTFFLDGRTAGNVLGVPHRTAYRWLDRLKKRNVLTAVREHDRLRKLATEYRFIERTT